MTEKPNVVEALTAVMADVQAIRKGDKNSQQGYSFRGIDAVMNAVGPAFRKHGVVCLPVETRTTYRDVQTTTGKPAREVTAVVTYRFYGPAGDYIEAQAPGESMDSGDKGTPKAMSVAYRTLLLQALTVPTDDPEPDAQSYERAPVERPKPHKPQTDQQRKRMHALLGELGLDDREKYVKLAAWFVHRDVESTSELTGDEAAGFIEYLAGRAKPAPAPADAPDEPLIPAATRGA